MKRTGNPQTNTKIYWNHIYTTPAKLKEYWDGTARYPTFVKQVKNGDKVLDMGCGVSVPGKTILDTKDKCEVWGVDISSEIIEANERDYPKGKWYQGYAGYNDFLPSDYFDIMFAGELIEHMDIPKVLFKEARRVLKKGGKLVISTPVDKRVDSPEHVWYFKQDDVEGLFMKNGFKKVEFVQLPDMEHLVVFFAVGK